MTGQPLYTYSIQGIIHMTRAWTNPKNHETYE